MPSPKSRALLAVALLSVTLTLAAVPDPAARHTCTTDGPLCLSVYTAKIAHRNAI